MPFDGHAGQWEPGKRKPSTRLPRWLSYGMVMFGAVMGAVFGCQAAIASGLFCSMVLSWPHALMSVPAPLFQPFAFAGACFGACLTAYLIRKNKKPGD